MAELLAELAPLVLAAAISPATIGIVILILATTERPVLRAGVFAVGFAVVLVALSVAGLVLLRGARDSLDEGSPLFAWIDISMGAALLVITAVSLSCQGDVGAAEERVRTVSPAAFLILGMAMMIDALQSTRKIELTVTGRKSGRESSRPVWFVQEGDKLFLLPVGGSTHLSSS